MTLEEQPAAEKKAPPLPPAGDAWTGRTLGKYRILARLRGGGIGARYPLSIISVLSSKALGPNGR